MHIKIKQIIHVSPKTFPIHGRMDGLRLLHFNAIIAVIKVELLLSSYATKNKNVRKFNLDQIKIY